MQRGGSSSGPARSSPICCWPTRSTGRRRRPRRRCSRRWPRARSASTARHTAARAVRRAGHRQPDRVRGHIPAARGAAGPVRDPARAGLPSEPEEGDVAPPTGPRLDAAGVQQVVDAAELLAMRESVEQVTVHEDVLEYVVALANATRAAPQVEVGASPRAELDLVQLASARAVLLGRDYVIPEDVKALAVPAMAHRISLRPEMWVRRIGGDDVVEELLRRIPVPRALARSDRDRPDGCRHLWRPSPLTRAIATCAAVDPGRCGVPVTLAAGRVRRPRYSVCCVRCCGNADPKVRVQSRADVLRCFETGRSLILRRVRRGRCRRDDFAADASAWRSSTGAGPPIRSCGVRADAGGRYRGARSWSRCRAPRGLLERTPRRSTSPTYRVFPVAPPQVDRLPRTELPDRLGTHLTRRIGPGVEFADIRAYVPGDQLRTVNWPVSARRGSAARDGAADRPCRRCRRPGRHLPAAARAGDRGDRADGTRRYAGRAERAAAGRPGGSRRPRRSTDRWLGPDIGRRQFYRSWIRSWALQAQFETATGTLAPRAAVPPVRSSWHSRPCSRPSSRSPDRPAQARPHGRCRRRARRFPVDGRARPALSPGCGRCSERSCTANGHHRGGRGALGAGDHS